MWSRDFDVDPSLMVGRSVSAMVQGLRPFTEYTVFVEASYRVVNVTEDVSIGPVVDRSIPVTQRTDGKYTFLYV